MKYIQTTDGRQVIDTMLTVHIIIE